MPLALALVVPLVSLASGASGGRTATPTLIGCAGSGGNAVVYRAAPQKCTIFGPGGSFGGGVNLAELQWRGWGGPSVAGTGFEQGFHLPLSNIPAGVVAWDKVTCKGRSYYTRLRATSNYGTTTVPRIKTPCS